MKWYNIKYNDWNYITVYTRSSNHCQLSLSTRLPVGIFKVQQVSVCSDTVSTQYQYSLAMCRNASWRFIYPSLQNSKDQTTITKISASGWTNKTRTKTTLSRKEITCLRKQNDNRLTFLTNQNRRKQDQSKWQSTPTIQTRNTLQSSTKNFTTGRVADWEKRRMRKCRLSPWRQPSWLLIYQVVCSCSQSQARTGNHSTNRLLEMAHPCLHMRLTKNKAHKQTQQTTQNMTTVITVYMYICSVIILYTYTYYYYKYYHYILSLLHTVINNNTATMSSVIHSIVVFYSIVFYCITRWCPVKILTLRHLCT